MATTIVSDWDDAFASMAPTPAEVEHERAYWQELDRQEGYADYLAARAEEQFLAAVGEDDRPERREYRGSDGLTKAERLSLYDAANYTVERTGPIQFRAVNVNGAEFEVGVIFGRFARVTSNTGNEYLLHNGACHCAHKQNGAPICKHEAAAAATMVLYRQDPLLLEVDAEVARLRAQREPVTSPKAEVASPALKAA